MAKSNKLYPGMRGAYVLLLKYGDTWVAYKGANSEDKLRAERRRLPQWPDHKVKIVPNVTEN
jgi:hypothetical protein